MTARDIHVQKMKEIKKEMQTSGAIHRKDLNKRLKRMEQELRDYDRYQAEAKKA